MIKLLAKNQSDGMYFFSEENDVYLISAPIETSEKEYVDSLQDFLHKSIDTDLTFETLEFKNVKALKKFAINDSDPKKRGITIKSMDNPPDDFLRDAPVEIIKEYFVIIKDMISNRSFSGLDIIFAQLSKNYEVIDNFMPELDELRVLRDNAIFPNIPDREIANNSTERIYTSGNVFCPQTTLCIA